MDKKEYFVFSDVHGFYDELMLSLDKAGFDINNPNHIIISCGDLMDRGPKPYECLEFVNNLPADRKILIRGNHEDLFDEIVKRKDFLLQDIHNKTEKTFIDIYQKLYNKEVNMNDVIEKVANCKEIKQYFASLVNFFETEHYIFVHGFIPLKRAKLDSRELVYFDDWRTGNWEIAMWYNGFIGGFLNLNKTGKTIVFGHWHTSYGRYLESNGKIPEFSDNSCFDPFYGSNYIGIDGCTVRTGQVNVLKIED